MTITAEKQPYEFLARWENGALKGAHIQWKIVVNDAGQISETLSPAEAVAVSGNAGFPLADLLDQTTADAVTAANAAAAAKALAESSRDSAIAERDAALAELATCQATLAAQDA